MTSGTELLRRLLDTMLPNRAAPVLAKVLKAHEGPGKNKYSCDVRVLTAGTLEETAQVISDVPLSPLWVSQKKRGVYAIPPEGQVVIVEFLCWNPGYPFISGMWSDEYEADEFKAGQFVITDGNGMKFVIDAEENKITIDNGKNSVVTLEEEKITADNGKIQVILNGEKAAVKNASKSLFSILDTHLQNLIAMKTVGSPVRHVVSPQDIQNFSE